jgi:hypothetical protein
MPRLVMIATNLIEWNRFNAVPGDRLEVSPGEAAVMLYRRWARMATAADDPLPPPPEPTPEPEPEPIAAAPKRRRRTYKTRDMRAQ